MESFREMRSTFSRIYWTNQRCVEFTLVMSLVYVQQNLNLYMLWCLFASQFMLQLFCAVGKTEGFN